MLFLSLQRPTLLSLLLSFSLFALSGYADDLSFDYESYSVLAKLGLVPHHNYITTEGTSPLLQVNTWHAERMAKSGSHIFLRNNGNNKQGTGPGATPLILRADDLSAVYMNRSFPSMFDVRVQQNKGQDVLTFFGGPCIIAGLGNGTSYVFDNSYRELYRVQPQNLTVKADLHEFQLNGDGTAILTAYDVIKREVSGVQGGEKAVGGIGEVRDSLFQELDLETNEVLFQWRASDHIDFGLSQSSYKEKWDWFHLNSIEKTKAGNYLISARHMSSLYLIDGKTGHVIWVLGGKDNQFSEIAPDGFLQASAPLLSMRGQHHARFVPGTDEKEITFFDNHGLTHWVGCTSGCSRGLHIRIDTSDSRNKTAQIVQEYLHPQGLRSGTQGSVQILKNGNAFVGWGANPSFTEHTPDGEVVLDVQFSPFRSEVTEQKSLDNYRAYRFDWKATPYWDPAIATIRHGGAVGAFLSWNGATEVRGWALYGAKTAAELGRLTDPIAVLPRSGFETAIHLGATEHKFMRAQALDANHHVIGTTGIYNILQDRLVPFPVDESSAIAHKGAASGKIPIHNSALDSSREYAKQVTGQLAEFPAWPLVLFGAVAGMVFCAYRFVHRRKSFNAAYRLISTSDA